MTAPEVRAEVRELRFGNAAALTDALAAEIIAQLQSALTAGRTASLVVPGGRSPVALFERLSREALLWQRVWITLSDERWVDVDSPASNERLVREHLLRNAAATAHFIGLKNDAADPRSGAQASWAALEPVPRSFDTVLLGMGEDGHFASLFPDSPGSAVALDPTQPPGCVAMVAPVPPRARISLNLSALLRARRIALLISGNVKWSVYERAQLRGPVVELPVRALLSQQRVPVSVYWSP
jgi:6-phosphogluconolactonase